MVNWLIMGGLAGITIGMGMVIGKWYSSRKEKLMGKTIFEHFEKEKVPMEMLEDISKPDKDLDTPIPDVAPQQNLKACWICGKLTVYDICSQEHYQEWISRTANNNSQLSEPVDRGNKVGEQKALKQTAIKSTPTSKVKKKVKANDN